ncbi:oxidoreductase [Aureispira anguillae]|uniref:Oxidoreductase n=1 Tax=Aureispira anguillae TaxID=2864201 RepID=A0A916DPX0_9BACT|nr:oxidoreductase [Aureispira anguillae]BDS09760.1 oxidoreductase [Aureispira anguillae]
MSKKTAIIIGASGLVGQELTQQLTVDDRYEKIIALVRKPLDIDHDKIEEVKYDFDWPNADLVMGDELFCCLGTTIKAAGSQAAFRKVDYDYVLETAKIALANGTKKMTMISSIGADKNSKVFYSRVKGEIEAALHELDFEACHILRPSLLMGSRNELRMGELVGKFAMTAFSFAIPNKYKGIESKQVAKAMIVAINSEKKGVQILESDDLLAV